MHQRQQASLFLLSHIDVKYTAYLRWSVSFEMLKRRNISSTLRCFIPAFIGEKNADA